MPIITFAHFVYLFFVLAILVCIAIKKDPMVITLVGLLVVGIMNTHSLVKGLQGVFNAIYTSAIGMFVIPLLIAVVIAFSKVLRETGADYIMVAPVKKLLGRPAISFWVLGFTIFALALVFWPMPAAGLVGTILVPIAISAGMTPLAAAVPLAMFGHGGATGGDWFLQGAPTVLANTSGLPISEILATSKPIVGVSLLVGSVVAWVMLKRSGAFNGEKSEAAAHSIEATKMAPYTAVMVLAALAIDIYIMVTQRLVGGDATYLLGGTILMLTALICLYEFKEKSLDKFIGVYKEGFVTAIEIFGPVFIISAFFMIGSAEGAGSVYGEGTPGYLVEIGQSIAHSGAVNIPLLAVVQTLVAALCGMDGAGFDQLPLLGSMAKALAPAIGANAVPLACLGQMVTIWTAGALVPWGFLAALAGFCGVSPIELARKNFIPTLCAFTAGTIVTIFLM